jgi:hypothetical protein
MNILKTTILLFIGFYACFLMACMYHFKPPVFMEKCLITAIGVSEIRHRGQKADRGGERRNRKAEGKKREKPSLHSVCWPPARAKSGA